MASDQSQCTVLELDKTLLQSVMLPLRIKTSIIYPLLLYVHTCVNVSVSVCACMHVSDAFTFTVYVRDVESVCADFPSARVCSPRLLQTEVTELSVPFFPELEKLESSPDIFLFSLAFVH